MYFKKHALPTFHKLAASLKCTSCNMHIHVYAHIKQLIVVFVDVTSTEDFQRYSGNY